MVLHLAEELDVPLRDRNHLLLAAGYAPGVRTAGARRAGDGAGARRDRQVLRGHEPYPALVVDRHWGLVAANRALARSSTASPTHSSSRRSTSFG